MYATLVWPYMRFPSFSPSEADYSREVMTVPTTPPLTLHITLSQQIRLSRSELQRPRWIAVAFF